MSIKHVEIWERHVSVNDPERRVRGLIRAALEEFGRTDEAKDPSDPFSFITASSRSLKIEPTKQE